MEKRTFGSQQQTPASAMYCNNCGEKGHVFRTCRGPIISSGLILLTTPSLPVKSDATQVLMIRRKDSMSFAEFMRGKYDPTNEPYVSTLIVNMTQDEQRQISTDPFETIWQRLWKGDTTSSDFLMSREKFGLLDIARLVAEYPSVYTEPEWGFPKGRRIRSETDLDCAIREFGEETNVHRDAYTVVNNVRLEETFMGLNTIMYRHIYFVALLAKPDLVNLTQRFTHMQNREISGLEWKSFGECRSFVRPHHVQRIPMLDALQNIVESYESEPEKTKSVSPKQE